LDLTEQHWQAEGCFPALLHTWDKLRRLLEINCGGGL
jgi:hypothetical protein